MDITTRAFGELEERESACGIVASGKSKKNLVTAMEKRLREVAAAKPVIFEVERVPTKYRS